MIGEILGGTADLGNFVYGIYNSEMNRKQQEAALKLDQERWTKEFRYNQMLNQQQQKNWEQQMQFQQDQANLSQANWEKNFQMQQDQFNANRIGNLTKEYAEAGLNPFLAAGMGAGTASVVGGGASAPSVGQPYFNTYHGNGAHITPVQSAEMKLQNMQTLFQMEQQKGINEASINKINAEARLAGAQADDLESTRADRIAKLRAETNLTNEQIEEVIARTNNIMANTKVQQATEILTNSKSTTQELENAKREIENEILADVKETEKEKARAELKKLKTENRVMNSKETRSWIDMILSKFTAAGWLTKAFM